MQMNSIELEVFAKEAAKGIKIHQDLNELSLLAVLLLLVRPPILALLRMTAIHSASKTRYLVIKH
jgi:hypothetical protein